MTSNRFCVLLYSTLLFVLFAICPARVIIYVLVHHVWPLFPAANREASLHAHGRHLNDRFPRLGGGVRRDQKIGRLEQRVIHTQRLAAKDIQPCGRNLAGRQGLQQILPR